MQTSLALKDQSSNGAVLCKLHLLWPYQPGVFGRQLDSKEGGGEEQTLCRSVAVSKVFSFLVEVRKHWISRSTSLKDQSINGVWRAELTWLWFRTTLRLPRTRVPLLRQHVSRTS